MNKDITLVILAAGMGSRFGGLKQIEPMGPSGEYIIDYSIYDAIKAGFTKVLFLIKKENYEIFKNTIGKRVGKYINVEYCFQEFTYLPNDYKLPEERVKPLGTAHALYCCKEKVNEPFMMINSDDFYGRDAFIKGAEFLKDMNPKNKEEFGIVSYLVKNTMTEHGSVKRGLCTVEKDKLVKLTESVIEKIGNDIIAKPLNGDKKFIIKEDDVVSMNMLLLNPSIFEFIENGFEGFFKENKNNLLTCEYLIPDVLFNAIKENYAEVIMIKTNATWFGVTYKEDTDNVKKSIKELVNKGIYNKNLWQQNSSKNN